MDNASNGSNWAILNWMDAIARNENPFKWVTDEQLTQAHTFAYSCYIKKHYATAMQIFRLLAVARPAEAKYWKGLGACLQMEHDYEQAIDCYLSARVCNMESKDPYLYVYTADCYFAMRETELGLKALASARVIAQSTQDQRVLKHVNFMQALWSKSSK